MNEFVPYFFVCDCDSMIFEDLDVLINGEVSVLVEIGVGERLPELVLPPPVEALPQHEAHGGPVQRHFHKNSKNSTFTNVWWPFQIDSAG